MWIIHTLGDKLQTFSFKKHQRLGMHCFIQVIYSVWMQILSECEWSVMLWKSPVWKHRRGFVTADCVLIYSDRPFCLSHSDLLDFHQLNALLFQDIEGLQDVCCLGLCVWYSGVFDGCIVGNAFINRIIKQYYIVQSMRDHKLIWIWLDKSDVYYILCLYVCSV